MSKVDVVIVNWNSGPQLAACVQSVLEHDEAAIGKLIVVDNASHDGSADLDIRSPKLLVVKSPENLGFGRACNLGAAQSDAPYILLLNPDTRLIGSAISDARNFLDSAEGQEFGVCGVKHFDENGQVASQCATFPRLSTFLAETLGLCSLFPKRFPIARMSNFDHLHSRSVDHVMGAFYLIRRALFERIGGLDDRFFVYFEDLDLSLRVAQAGYGSYYLADTEIFHRGGGTSHQVKGRALAYLLEGRLKYSVKHFGRSGYLAVLFVTLFVDPVTRTVHNVATGSARDAWKIFEGHALLWKRLGREALEHIRREDGQARRTS